MPRPWSVVSKKYFSLCRRQPEAVQKAHQGLLLGDVFRSLDGLDRPEANPGRLGKVCLRESLCQAQPTDLAGKFAWLTVLALGFCKVHCLIIADAKPVVTGSDRYVTARKVGMPAGICALSRGHDIAQDRSSKATDAHPAQRRLHLVFGRPR